MIVTGRWAVIGSANASHSSTTSDPGIITDDPEVVAAVRTFIDGTDEITEVDRVFLDNATAIWQICRAAPLPGIGARNGAEPDFFPIPVTRMFLWHITNYLPGAAEQHERAAHSGRRRTSAGPAAKYQLEGFRIDTPGGRGRLQRGDVRLQVTADNEWLCPPAVVDSDPIAIPHPRKAIAYRRRTRVDLEPTAVTDAEVLLADLGHPDPRLRADHPHRLHQPAGRPAPTLEPVIGPHIQARNHDYDMPRIDTHRPCRGQRLEWPDQRQRGEGASLHRGYPQIPGRPVREVGVVLRAVDCWWVPPVVTNCAPGALQHASTSVADRQRG
ncbi:hypothetical protein GFS60_06435 (plasmid) [Rhodococcus sp. WAY2]|nr:hypothetical protein GFS60_06435 [Rhodococcus sp. WAY2]